MKLLLDTHVVLWWLLDDARLSATMADRLDSDPDVFISTATAWEVTIKHSAGKLTGPVDLPERVADCGFVTLPVGMMHALAAGRLPLLHRDPFDRMLVAQARCDDLTIVTDDSAIRRYDVPTLFA